MKILESIGRWLLLVIIFVAISFPVRNASAGRVAEFGESGYLDFNYQGQLRLGKRDTGSGPQGTDPTWDLQFRRNRLGLLGAVNDTWAFAVQMEYLGGKNIGPLDTNPQGSSKPYKPSLLDYYAQATFTNALQFRAGKEKHPLTREVNEGCFAALTLDRSDFILGPFANKRGDKTTRDIGIVAMGNLFSDVFQYRLAAMQGNNFGDDKPADIGYRYTGRVHLTLLDPESGWGYRGSYLGKKKVLTFGAGVDTQPNAVYYAGTTGSQSYFAYTGDAFYEQPTRFGTFTLSGAYLKADFGGAGSRGVADAMEESGEKNGWYGKGAYMLGKAQVYGRYEKWSFASLRGVMGQQLTFTAEGVNYYINGQDLRLTLEFSKTEFERGSVPGFNTIFAQVQALF